MRCRMRPVEARRLVRKAGTICVSLAGAMLMLFLSGVPKDVEQADVLDTHRQRMLQDVGGGPGPGGLFSRATDWAKRHVIGNYSDTRHASAYLNYQPPTRTGATITAWYHQLTPRHSADDTYFAVEGTQFGYFGLQQLRDRPWFDGKVVFSMWDKGSEAGGNAEDRAQVVECGELAFCTRFGGEGTGAKSYINFDHWSLHRNYSFITTAMDIGGGRAQLAGYLYAEELGGWVLLSKLQVLRGGLPSGISNMYSFTEQWSTKDFGVTRWAQLGPSFVQFTPGAGEWTQVRYATFSKTSAPQENGEAVNANLTDHDREWGLGMGEGAGKGTFKSLMVIAVDELPPELEAWSELVKADSLPKGCPGGTCHHRWWITLVTENFKSSNLLRTAAFILLFVVIVVWVICACRTLGCCDGHDEHGDSQRIRGDEEDPEEELWPHEKEHDYGAPPRK